MLIRLGLLTLLCAAGISLPSFAAEPSGFFSCEGYYSGSSTDYKRINSIISLEIRKDKVIIQSGYYFFGTNLKNPLSDKSFLNCGTEFPPKFKFRNNTCDVYDPKRNYQMTVEDVGVLNVVTNQLGISHIRDDASAEFFCKKSNYSR